MKLLVLVFLGSLPAAVAAVLLSDHIKASFADPVLVGTCLLALGFVLLATDWLPPGRDEFHAMRWWQALAVGLGQAVAAVARGMSRSGMTIAAGLAFGLRRDWAVRFSFLLSIVANLGLAGLGVVKALGDPDAADWLTANFLVLTGVGVLVSAVVGYITIAPLLVLVRRARLWWFAVYVWVVGTAVLIWH
jgi:undecaprenyl-diphosphatase